MTKFGQGRLFGPSRGSFWSWSADACSSRCGRGSGTSMDFRTKFGGNRSCNSQSFSSLICTSTRTSVQMLWMFPLKRYYSRASNQSNGKSRLCSGCGAVFQSSSPNAPGYSPSSLNRSKNTDEKQICNRCLRLRNHNATFDPCYPDPTKIFGDLRISRAGVVVHVIDASDFPGSYVGDLDRFIGPKPSILAVNKIDLMPSSMCRSSLHRWFRRAITTMGTYSRFEKIHLISAKTGFGLMELVENIAEMTQRNKDEISKIDDIQQQQNTYLVGCSNVGKSEILNSFLRMGGRDPVITSHFSFGTTAAMVKLPLSSFNGLFTVAQDDDNVSTSSPSYVFDTPGLEGREQLTTYLNSNELKYVIPSKEIKPVTHALGKGKAVYLGGLARLDIVDSKQPVQCTFYGSHRLPLSVCRLERADSLYRQHVLDGSEGFLVPPIYNSSNELDLQRKAELRLEMASDVQVKLSKGGCTFGIAGVGWITLTGTSDAHVRIFSLRGEGIHVRPNF